MRVLFSLFCAAFCAIYGNAQPGAADQQDQKTTFTGTVIDTATGQGLAGALVTFDTRRVITLDGPGALPAQTASGSLITDSSGSFEFHADFRPNGAEITAARRGYRAENDADTASLFVTSNKTDGLTIKLVPQSVITGKIVNEDNEPLPHMTVQAILMQVADGRRSPRVYRSERTDDRGEYRLWNLPPGSYYLKALGRVGTDYVAVNSVQFGGSDQVYGPVYFPSADTRSAAQPIRLGPGQTVDADFRLEPRPGVQIRGTILHFQPGRLLSIRLLRGGDPTGNRASVDPDHGTFQVADVAPGTYRIQLYAGGNPQWLGETDVVVGDRDATGVTVAMNSGLEVRGHVEGGSAGPDGRVFGLIQARPADPAAIPFPLRPVQARLDQNGEFTLTGLLPGTYDLSVIGTLDAYVSAISSGNQDVLAQGLTVGPQGAPELQIVLQSGGGTVQGTVTDPGGSPSAQIVLVSREHPGNPLLVYGFQDKFNTPPLAPGDYTVYAWPNAKSLEYRNPDALAAFSSYAAQVTVHDGEAEKIEVKLIPAEAIP